MPFPVERVFYNPKSTPAGLLAAAFLPQQQTSPMFELISKKQREKKRQEAHEKALRESLAEKLSRYEKSRSDQVESGDDGDFTELYVNGRKLRVPK